MLSDLKHLVKKALRPDVGRKRSFPSVELTYWQSKRGVPNFGDDLSKVIVSLMLSTKGLTLDDEAWHQTQLLAIGSIIHFAENGAVVWGSGINGKIPESELRFRALDVRAVRGPRTADMLGSRGIQVPEVFGDPALLLPQLAPSRFSRKSRFSAVFVPNLNDVLHDEKIALPSDVPLISPMQSWHKVICAILEADFVVSSSLHGLVIAEAYGIPAQYVRLSDHENMFKFEDYLEGTGRTLGKVPTTIDRALDMGGFAPLQFDSARLMGAFPFDLWFP